MKLAIALVLSALAIPALAQTPKSAPSKGLVILSGDLQTQLQNLSAGAKAKGSSGSTITEFTGNSLKLSVRTTSGGAEIHTHFDDVMLVTQGSAILITGGEIVDAKTGADGETHGPSIKGGERRSVQVGDLILVPAGLPHQLIIPPNTLYSAVVIKVKE